MAKIVKFFLFFFLIIFLWGGDFDRNFSNFDKNFDNSSKAVKEKFHKELKDIYLQTSIDKNKIDRINVLKRLVHSSKALKLNHKGYESELNLLGDSYENYQKINLAKFTPKDSKSANEKAVLKQDEKTKIKNEKPQNLNKQSNKNKSPKEKNIIIVKEPKSYEVNKNIRLRLKSVDKTDTGIKLRFNRNVSEDEIKKFALKSKEYRNVIDIKAVNDAKISKISRHLSDEIRVAQYNPKTTRVVFTQKNSFNINLKYDEKSILIDIKNPSNSVNLTIPPVAKTSSNGKKIAQNKKESLKIDRKQRTIVIDPGHGGKDSGAIGNGLKEKDLVLKISQFLGDELKNMGYKVLFTRNKDVFINLKDRTAFANKKNADMFISIHINAGPKTKSGSLLSGVETFFLSPARSERSKNAAALENKGDIEDMNHFSQETYLNFLNREKIIASNKVAIDIQKHMLNKVQAKYNVKDGGVREAPFWVLVGATMPAILVECGYISNKNDSKNLASREYQKLIAEGVANGVDAYFLKNE
ncbi:N-acetylmuramoyl-L-alanine amidase [Campylobacter ureolyticus]|uniref:N-acetylmuramoyl-L-alanine amidase family protein n=1 Tax=Campylobacter ureolyticus TaxID=827 RepID=UPI0022B4851B|nr:N-acetylmuramoyl-L-alanine amidase [Campylobacter ureolyticus]MCZ6174494.1 N-acetylmuramoyl-L-alanine amidase [Campylobacter ureolyticus]MCZ6186239.1 N-acetylmuramoyl-L-alanine amidase [Campylobacter ureolyticus]